MSLLLDALKKSGDKQQQNAGLSNLTLEDVPESRASASSSTTASSRIAGETMFAAKKKKPAPSFRWKLGLVPSTLLFALIFGSGYGYYVWLEIQPPKQYVAQHIAPPPTPRPAATPARTTAPALVPFIPPQESPPPAQPVVTAKKENFDAPRSKPKVTRKHSTAAQKRVRIRRKVVADTVTPALLDAYQAYQRGDYVVAAQGYRQVLGKDMHNRDALLGLAAIAQQQGQEEAAQHYYRQLLTLNPRDPAALTALMTYAPDEGNTESRLKTMLADQPRSSALHFALGNYYADISDWSDAQQYYFNALALDPTNAQFAFNLAVSLDHMGQRKLAARYYQQAVQLDKSGKSGFDHAQAQQRLNELTSVQ